MRRGSGARHVTNKERGPPAATRTSLGAPEGAIVMGRKNKLMGMVMLEVTAWCVLVMPYMLVFQSVAMENQGHVVLSAGTHPPQW